MWFSECVLRYLILSEKTFIAGIRHPFSLSNIKLLDISCKCRTNVRILSTSFYYKLYIYIYTCICSVFCTGWLWFNYWPTSWVEFISIIRNKPTVFLLIIHPESGQWLKISNQFLVFYFLLKVSLIYYLYTFVVWFVSIQIFIDRHYPLVHGPLT